jgi:hypothetical protein
MPAVLCYVPCVYTQYISVKKYYQYLVSELFLAADNQRGHFCVQIYVILEATGWSGLYVYFTSVLGVIGRVQLNYFYEEPLGAA